MNDVRRATSRCERVKEKTRAQKRKLLKRKDARESHTDPQRRVSHKDDDKRKVQPL